MAAFRPLGELVLMFGSLGPPKVIGRRLVSTLAAAAGVIDLSPKLRGLSAGQSPRGTSVVTNALMPICPPRSSGEQFIFRLFALPAGHEITRASLRLSSPESFEEVSRNAGRR